MGLFGKKKKTPEPDELEGGISPSGVSEAAAPAEKKKKKAAAPKRQPDVEIEVTEEDGAKVHYIAMVAERTTRARTQKLLSMSLMANVALLLITAFVFYWAVLYKKDVYFATTNDGRIQELVPLNEPYVSIAGVSNWTAQAITETYSLDFRNWRKTLAKVRNFYSDAAWKQLEEQIQPLLESIERERLILYAVADEAPRLLHKGLFSKDLYAWKLEFPMTLTHQTADSTINFNWIAQVLVGRANVAEKEDGVEIIQFVIRPKKSIDGQ